MSSRSPATPGKDPRLPPEASWLYTSHMGARAGSPFAPADQHAGTEADLAVGGVAFTALRHGFYAESCLYMIKDGLEAGELRTPEDGPVSWTARADLAEADAAIMTRRAARRLCRHGPGAGTAARTPASNAT